MQLNRSRVLITGGGGFLGRNLTQALLREGAVVRILDRSKPLWLDDPVEFFEADFTAAHSVESGMDECDAVVHLACTTLPKSSNDDPQFDVSSNLLGSVGLLELAVKKKIGNFLFASSGGTVYGAPSALPVAETAATEPLCSYAITKLAIEKYLRLFYKIHGLPCTSLRFSNPYGPYQRVDRSQGVVAVFCHNALRGHPLQVWGDGGVVRDFVFVQDVTRAMVQALKTPGTGDVFNIGSGQGTSVNDLIHALEDLLGQKLAVNYTPGRTFDVPGIYLDISKAGRLLDWKPELSLRQGLDKTLAWMKMAYMNQTQCEQSAKV
jgi:UDP-glucose 4-epimerase